MARGGKVATTAALGNAKGGAAVLSSVKKKELGAVVAEVECTDNQSRGSPKGSADSGSTAGLLYFVCHGAVSGARPVPMVRVAFQLVHRLFGDASARAVS